MPVLVGGLHKLAGITAPAFIPLKAKYLIKDCKLWADKYKVKYQFNRYFPIKTVNLMRSALVAEKDNFLRSFVDKAFNAVWVESLNMNDDEVFLKFIKEQDINSDLSDTGMLLQSFFRDPRHNLNYHSGINSLADMIFGQIQSVIP
ncbi:MAG: DsbA family protein, partial [Candidatus Fonsibacter sp.]